jgi:hypothetical protein
MKRKFLIVISCLAFFGLACLSTSMSAAVVVQPTEVATRIEKMATFSAATLTPTLSLEGEGDRCAVVIAETAVHLRGAPSAMSAILEHLRNGDDVDLLDTSSATWWRVRHGVYIGFVKVKYLEKIQCVENGE